MKTRNGFTIIELLTVITIITVLTSISVPAMRGARGFARRLINMRNQRETVLAVNVFACENKDQYPATTAARSYSNGSWMWQDPRKIKNSRSRFPRENTSMAAYLATYISDPKMLFCPNAPKKYPYWDDAWQQGESWDHPETEPEMDPVLGAYCFYWNYRGYMATPDGPFVGPTGLNGGPRESRILVSDYVGYNNWRAPGCVGSCEPLSNAEVAAGTEVSSDFWSVKLDEGQTLESLDETFYAGYTDGHVGRFSASETVSMRVAGNARASKPFPNILESPGEFFVPLAALPRK